MLRGPLGSRVSSPARPLTSARATTVAESIGPQAAEECRELENRRLEGLSGEVWHHLVSVGPDGYRAVR